MDWFWCLQGFFSSLNDQRGNRRSSRSQLQSSCLNSNFRTWTTEKPSQTVWRTFDTFENQLSPLQTPRYGHLLQRESKAGLNSGEVSQTKLHLSCQDSSHYSYSRGSQRYGRRVLYPSTCWYHDDAATAFFDDDNNLESHLNNNNNEKSKIIKNTNN